MANRNVSLVRIAVQLLTDTFKSWPLVASLYVFLGIVFGVMTGLGVWIMQFAFDSVTELALGSRTTLETIIPILIVTIFLISQEIVIALHNYYMNSINARMKGFMNKKVAEKTNQMDAVLFEDPKVLDDINKAREATRSAFWVGNTIITAATLYIPYILVISFYLYQLNPLLILVILLTFLTKIVALGIRSKLYTDLEEHAAPLRRKRAFYEEAMVGREYFKETRMLGAFSFFKNKYSTVVRLLNNETWKADSRAATFELLTESVNGLNYFAILYLLYYSLQNGWITVGAFAAVLASINELSEMVEELINEHLTVISEDLGKMSSLIQLFDLPEKTGERKSVDWNSDIVFDRVSFTYPFTTYKSIDDISLSIKAGETIAIVGENGAGKSTFTKLLLGLYKPTSGEISVGGQPTKTILPDTFYRGISAVFQHFQRYQLTLEENIRISDVESKAEINPVMQQAGVEWASHSYPEGIKTMLSREFEGVDLSGGQWQRISIARGLYRPHDLIVLDEPTAAIDPLEENRLYEKFAEIAKEKTAIIVTHRLGSARIADRIVVMKNGRLVEVGTHKELLAANDYYAEMYRSQASWYIDS